MQLKFQGVNDYGKECKTKRRCEFEHVVKTTYMTEDLFSDNLNNLLNALASLQTIPSFISLKIDNFEKEGIFTFWGGVVHKWRQIFFLIFGSLLPPSHVTIFLSLGHQFFLIIWPLLVLRFGDVVDGWPLVLFPSSFRLRCPYIFLFFWLRYHVNLRTLGWLVGNSCKQRDFFVIHGCCR